MPISAGTLSKLIAAGLSGQDLVDVVASIDADMSGIVTNVERSAAAIRQERYRERKAARTVTRDVTSDVTPPAPSSFPLVPPSQTLPPIIPQTPSPPPETARAKTGDLKAEFDGDFWPLYPNKVGKPDAFRAFGKARARADLETILAGLRRYVGKTDDRPWCNPSTWLNQDRWGDMPATVARGQPPPRIGTGNAAVDRLDQLISRATRNGDEHHGPTIEASDFDRNDVRPPQAVLSLAAAWRVNDQGG